MDGPPPMVNLLPWREQRRERRRRRFLALLVVAALACGAVSLLLHRAISANIADSTAENQRLRFEVARLEARNAEAERLRGEQEQTLRHMQVLKQLQRSRPLAAEILAQLARSLPDAAHYRRIARSGAELRIEGEAESQAAIAELMRELAASPLFGGVELAGVAEAESVAAVSGDFAFSLFLPLAGDGS